MAARGACAAAGRPAAPHRLAVEPVDLRIYKLADIKRAVASLADRSNAGVFFLPDLTVNALRAEVVGLAEPRRLPAMYSEAMFVKSGGLALYGVDRIDLYRRAAGRSLPRPTFNEYC